MQDEKTVQRLLGKGHENALRRLMHKNALDMQAIEQAMWEDIGGIEGFLGELRTIYDEERAAGQNKIPLQILKMRIDMTEKAQAAGEKAVDQMTDDELEAVIHGTVSQMLKDDPSLAKDLILAKAKPATATPDLDFLT